MPPFDGGERSERNPILAPALKKNSLRAGTPPRKSPPPKSRAIAPAHGPVQVPSPAPRMNGKRNISLSDVKHLVVPSPAPRNTDFVTAAVTNRERERTLSEMLRVRKEAHDASTTELFAALRTKHDKGNALSSLVGFTIPPHRTGNFRSFWDWAVLILVGFTSLWVPYRVRLEPWARVARF